MERGRDGGEWGQSQSTSVERQSGKEEVGTTSLPPSAVLFLGAG